MKNEPITLTNVEIQKILPHRYPFLLIDKIVDFEEGKSITGIKNVTANEPQFTGHFPGNPIMPGVLITEALAQVGAVMLLSMPENRGKLGVFTGINNFKFRRQVVPGDTLELHADLVTYRHGMGKANVKATVGGQVAAAGEISFAVPLLLSARTNTPKIFGLEIQEDIAQMAQRSVEHNKLEDRISIECGDLKNAVSIYGRDSFDKITCNPPYMKCGSGNQNDIDTKSISRHEVMCTVDDVINISAKLLIPKGRFFMIHRPNRLVDIMCAMRKYKIEPKRMRFVHPSYDKVPNMVLIEGMRDGGEELKLLPPLYVYNQDGTYSDEIHKIYGN